MSNTNGETEINVETYFYIVEATAAKLYKKYKGYQKGLAKLFEYEDLYQCGMIGLMQAAQNFKPTDNNTFATYAYYRILGSMIDHLRSLDTISRSQRSVVSKILENFEKTSEMSAEDSAALVKNNGIDTQFDVFDHDDDHSLSDVRAFEIKDSILKAMKLLNFSENEEFIIQKHFFEQASLDSIAPQLKIHPSRVSQLYSGALTKLRNNSHLFGGQLHVRTLKQPAKRRSNKTSGNSESADNVSAGTKPECSGNSGETASISA